MSRAWDIDLSIYPDEAALLEGLRAGNRYACSCLLKHFGPRLYRVALQMTGDPDEAEDVLQEALIRSCEHIGDFKGSSALGTWLHRITVTTALMHLRRRGSALTPVTTLGDDSPPGADPFVDLSAGPSDEVLSAELRERLEAAILALPDTLRLAFVLRDIEGLTTKAAAEVLGISESALKVRLHRARLALRASLAAYLHSPAGAEDGVR
jgi:RNA polymerase sigma-70 factor (ECF subfamily)